MAKTRVYHAGGWYRWHCDDCRATSSGFQAHIVAVNDARAHVCPKGEA